MDFQRIAAGLSLVAVVTIAACSTSASSVAPSRTATPSVLPSLTGSARPATASQTDTEWGRIWDTLPGDFPAYPGATPAEETAAGPASAKLVVTGGDARTIVTALQTFLTRAGYATGGLSGPLEDGDYVLDMTGPPAGCNVEVRVAPTGGLVTLTILYGAACPHG